jgi:hypothetical protein
MDGYSVLQSVIGLFGLWVGIHYLWQDFRRDSFREDIFTVRDELFLYAAEGNIDFSDPAYRILRNRMNALVRHGHDLTLTRAFLLGITHEGTKNEITVRWEEAIERLPVEVEQAIKMYNLRIAIFVLQHVVYCSFLRYLVVRPFLTGANIHQLIETPVVASGVQKLESKTVEEDYLLLGQPAAA